MASKQQMDDFTNRCKALFDEADEDGNAELSQTELTKIIHKLAPSLTDEEITAVFQDLDKNQDKRLSWLEFSDVLNAVKRCELKARFTKMDKDGSGKISLDELRAEYVGMGINLSEDQLQAFMNQADKDGDSLICYEEFLGFWSTAELPEPKQ